MRREIYFLFLVIFILYIVFAVFDGWEDVYVNWYPLKRDQSVTVQYYFWMLFMRAAMFLIFRAWYFESKEENKRMLRILMFIHLWYFVEYILHYTSVWYVWPGSKYSGLSSHIITMLIFAVYGGKSKK